MKSRTALLILMLLLCRAAAAEEGFILWHGVQRISYETLDLPRDERIGLAGFQYLVDVSPRWYAGVGLFGAVTGERGGFFTGGIEAGLRQPLAGPLSFEGGLFLGGGGGGNSPQGGGLMARPHVGLLYDLEDVRLSLAYALVDFPNGEIRSRHAVFLLDVPFEALRIAPDSHENLAALSDRASRAANRALTFSREHLTARYTLYFPPDATTGVNGAKTGKLQSTGIEYGRDLGERTYLFGEASGASGGGSDGYAEVFFGGGYRMPIYGRSLFLDSRISAGAAGGGNVNTGGGGAGKASLGLKFGAGDGLSLEARAGYETTAGDFRAKLLEFGLGYAFDTAAFDGYSAPRRPDADELRTDSWRTRFSFQQFTSRMASMRKGGEDNGVSFLGVKLDRFFGASKTVYLTGQGQSAVAGGAGGYSIGLIGLGYLSGPLGGSGFHVFAEALGGAAGGGGMDVGGGGVIQPFAGVLYDLSSSVGIEVSGGKIKALDGGLDSFILGGGVVYRFSTLGRKGDDG